MDEMYLLFHDGETLTFGMICDQAAQLDGCPLEGTARNHQMRGSTTRKPAFSAFLQTRSLSKGLRSSLLGASAKG